MSYLVIFLLLASPQITTGNLLFTSALPPKLIPVKAKIDFGPAHQPTIEKEIKVLEGITPKKALSQIANIQEGAACCNRAEVSGINGVTIDPLENRWWRLKINGTSKNASPHKSHLRSGDVMEWEYFEDPQ